MRAKEFKILMEFAALHTQEETHSLANHIDEIYFLQSAWKKYFGEVDYLKIYPHFKIETSKIFSISEKMDHFIIEHKENFSSVKTNLVFHGHIVENYRFFFKDIEITDLIVFDKI